jgi:L,D-peptidoglycan transpeptidase YkuD (ErfK/YbiS/YcfS/YnhG family)
LAAAVVSLLLAPEAEANYCPRVLHRATRLVIVLVPDMSSPKGTMRTFERKSPAARWEGRSEPEPAVVGTDGIAWGHPFQSFAKDGEPLKREGDKRAPAGIYRFGPSFGFAKAANADHLRLEPGRHYCVDDARSPHYGRIVERRVAGEKSSGEDMAAFPLYKRGLVIDYPPRRRTQAGACIFLHVWGGEGVGTAGCVALPEPRVAHLQGWAKGRHTVIVILHEDAVARFKSCLPLTEVASGPEARAAIPLPTPKRRAVR